MPRAARRLLGDEGLGLEVAAAPAVGPEEPLPPAKPRPRALGGFLRRERETAQDGLRLPRDSVDTLDQVLLDLLECKRLLDQVR